MANVASAVEAAVEARCDRLGQIAYMGVVTRQRQVLINYGPWTDAQLDTYQDRVEGIWDRLAALVQRKPKLIRGVRQWGRSYGLGGGR